MRPLVSIIIPCYNAGPWIGEAIQSCLNQTYSPIEVIVIDDGSTDRSLEVIKSFGEKILWETGPNRGGNHARNRGFGLSKGDYIQFLDADDYFLPRKIEQQIRMLSSTEADVVYEDYHRFEESVDGSRKWQPTIVSGEQPDILETLLTNWAPPPCVFLFTRRAVEKSGGWNMQLTSAQDWDLHIRLALAGAIYKYRPGSQSVNRRPSVPTTTTRNSRDLHENIVTVLRATEAKLLESGRLTENYKRAMAHTYLQIASCSSLYFDRDRARFYELLHEGQRLSPSYVYPYSRLYSIIGSTFGMPTAEHLRSLRRRLLKFCVDRNFLSLL